MTLNAWLNYFGFGYRRGGQVIVCLVTASAWAVDVNNYAVMKGRLFDQYSAGEPVLQSEGYNFRATVAPVSTGAVLSVTGTLPSGFSGPLDFEAASNLFIAEESTATAGELDEFAGAGTYKLLIQTLHDGNREVTLDLPVANYPAAPRVLNYVAAQAVDPDRDFIVQWAPIPGARPGDYVRFGVLDEQDRLLFEYPATHLPAARGTNTTALVPAGTLLPGKSYFGYIRFFSVTSRDTNSYHGAVGVAGFIARTQFPLHTINPAIPDETAAFATPILWIKGGQGPTAAGVFSSDNQYVATAGNGANYQDASVKIWRLADGKLLKTLNTSYPIEGTGEYDFYLAASPDDRLLAHLHSSKRLRIWRTSDWALVDVISPAGAGPIAFSPDGLVVACPAGNQWSQDKVINLWLVGRNAVLHQLKAGDSFFTCVAFSPDGQYLAAGREDNKICLWNWQTGELVKVLDGHSFSVVSVAFSPDSATLASSSRDTSIMLWQAPDWDAGLTISGRGLTWQSLDFSPDGARLAAWATKEGSTNSSVSTWRVADGSNLVNSPATNLQWAAFSPDLESYVTMDWIVKETMFVATDIRRVADNQLLIQLNEFCGPNTAVDFTPDGNWCAGGGHYQEASVWGPFDGIPRHQLHVNGYLTYVMHVAFAPDNQAMAVGGMSSQVRLINLQSGVVSIPFPTQTGAPELAFSPDGTKLATYGEAGIELWNFGTSNRLWVQPPGRQFGGTISYSRDGGAIVAAESENGARVVNAANGEILRVFNGAVAAFTWDGQYLAIAEDATQQIKLYRAQGFGLAKSLTGHSNTVTALASTQDGTLLAAGTEGAICFWRVADGALVRVLKNEAFKITSLAFSPDGQFLLYGRYDGTVIMAVNPLVADQDSDDDGYPDWQEAQAGTNPKDSHSALRLFTAGAPAINNVPQMQVSFLAKPYRNYSLWYSDDLLQWDKELGFDYLTDEQTRVLLTPSTNGHRFYQLRMP